MAWRPVSLPICILNTWTHTGQKFVDVPGYTESDTYVARLLLDRAADAEGAGCPGESTAHGIWFTNPPWGNVKSRGVAVPGVSFLETGGGSSSLARAPFPNLLGGLLLTHAQGSPLAWAFFPDEQHRFPSSLCWPSRGRGLCLPCGAGALLRVPRVAFSEEHSGPAREGQCGVGDNTRASHSRHPQFAGLSLQEATAESCLSPDVQEVTTQTPLRRDGLAHLTRRLAPCKAGRPGRMGAARCGVWGVGGGWQSGEYKSPKGG